MNTNKQLSAVACLLLSVSLVRAGGLVITPTFDSTITTDPNAATIENSINAAIQYYERQFGDPITVTILFQEMGSGLGQSSTYYSTMTYSDYFTALTADATTTNDAIALAHLPGGPNNPVDGTPNIDVTTANQRAIGFNTTPPPGQPDSTIGLNTSLMNLDRTTIDPNKYDLMAVVWHEIDEALGTSSGLGQGNIRPVDLFRYTAEGSRTYTTAGDDAYFSIDGGATDLARYNQDASGDYGDWWSTGPHTPQVQDAFGTPGATPNPGVELIVLDVIGYDLASAVPPPMLQVVPGPGNAVTLTWNTVSRRTYQLQYATNLNSPITWNNLGAPITGTGSPLTISDSATNPMRFYRVLLAPDPLSAATPRPSAMATGPLQLRTTYLRPKALTAPR